MRRYRRLIVVAIAVVLLILIADFGYAAYKEIFTVQGKVAANTVTGTATTTVYMTDFGIQPPNLSDIAIAQNKVLITIIFTAQEG